MYKRQNNSFDLNVIEGINIEKLDKACLIFDTERGDGFKLCILDKRNRNADARYWRDDFLVTTPRKDEYHATTTYISMTNAYIKDRLPHQSEELKVDEADIKYRSKSYLSSNEVFDKEEYENTVFKSEEMKANFKEYQEDYQQERNVRLQDNFEISEFAVKKKNRTFRSVIKLDKNFHVYVHGDRSKIERIEDSDGTKYYKLYFDDET